MQDILPAKVKKCYACIQWDGNRTYDNAKFTIRTDTRSDANCRVKRTKVRGSHTCEQYFPLQ